MALKHDAQGFLTGDPIDIGRAVSVLGDIRSDVRAIRRAITNPSVKAMQEVAQKNTASATPAQSSTPAGRMGATKSESNQALRVGVDRHKVTAASPAARDGSGRFVKKSGAESSDPKEPTESALKGFASRVAGAINGAGDGVSEVDPTVKAMQEVAQPMARGYALLSGGSAEKRKDGLLRRIYSSLTGLRTDQAVFNKSAKKSLKGIEDKDEGKGGGSGGIWGMLGGLLGGLMSMLGCIPVIGPLLVGLAGAIKNLLAKVPVIGAPFRKSPTTTGGISGGDVAKTGSKAGTAEGAVAKGAKGVTGEAGAVAKGGGLLKGAGKLLKGLPWLGALLAGVGAVASIHSSETDESLSRREKDENAGKSIGGLGGTIGGMAAGGSAGAALGTLIFPGIGTAIGTVVGGVIGGFLGDEAGQIIGKAMGGLASDLRESWGSVVGAWNGVANVISSAATLAWDGISSSASAAWAGATALWGSIESTSSAAWDGIKDAANSTNDAIKEFTGIDIKGMISSATDMLSIAANSLGEWVSKTTGKAWDAVKGAAQQAANFANKTWDESTAGKGAKALTGWISKHYESGKSGAGTVSTGEGDTGGASYGSYQLSSKTGAAKEFLKSSVYGKEFEGLEPGSEAFGKKWKEVADSDPEAFGAAQHDFIKKTRYEPALNELKKSGIDLSGRGNAVQESLFSTSVQFGAGKAGGERGAAPMIAKALAGKDVSKMSDEEVISAIQDYKIANNETLFASSSDSVRAGTAKRAVEEKKSLLALTGLPISKGAPVASVVAPVVTPALGIAAPLAPPVVKSVAAPLPPKMPAPPATSASVEIPELQSGREGGRTISVTMPAQDVGQDIRDRRIAHIATGGLSGYS